jgi:hypothetical protein
MSLVIVDTPIPLKTDVDGVVRLSPRTEDHATASGWREF